MWPLFLYINKEECVKYLRQLELETYASLVSVLRAQGALTSEKRKILKDVGKILNITIDRHKCEIRRAINDEKLNTIAYQLNNGHAGNLEDWCQEGKRIIPVLQRISPQTLHPIPITDESTCYSNNEEEKDEIRLIEMEEEIQVDDEPSAADGLKKSFSVTKKNLPNKNQKVMLVSNADTATIPTNNSILHKTLSVPISKVTKLKLDKFKIIPSSFSANVTNKNFFTKGNKKIIPLSQLQILNHKLSSKGGIKVLPINSKIIGKKITMTRFNNNNNNNNNQTMKTTIIQPSSSSSQTITVENTTDNNAIAETDEEKIEEIKEQQENEEEEEIVVEANIENIDVEYNDKVFNNKKEEELSENVANDLDDLAYSLLQIDCSELIES